MLRPREACERLGASYTTLREYVKRGWIKPVVLESGKWRFREEDVEKLMGIVKPKTVVLYVRVSSHTQKDDLERQVKVLEEWARLTPSGFRLSRSRLSTLTTTTLV